MNPAMGGGGGGMGTLQALLTELSGLKKPRGFFSRRLRRCSASSRRRRPKYRILVMMATNMPDSARRGAAAAGPHRPHLQGRLPARRQGGSARTRATSTRSSTTSPTPRSTSSATVTPYATGATIKDLVNESLIVAMRNGRDMVTWADMSEGEEAQELTAVRRLDVHRARAPRHRDPRGVPRGAVVPAAEAASASTSPPSSAAANRRLRAADPAGGALHRVAHRARERRVVTPGLARRRADVLRRRQLVRRRRRPPQRHDARPRHGGPAGAWAPASASRACHRCRAAGASARRPTARDRSLLETHLGRRVGGSPRSGSRPRPRRMLQENRR